MRKDTRPSFAFLYYKQQKAGQGLGTRLWCGACKVETAKHRSKHIWNMANTAAIAKLHKYCVWPMTIAWLPGTSDSISWSWCSHENVMTFPSKVITIQNSKKSQGTCITELDMLSLTFKGTHMSFMCSFVPRLRQAFCRLQYKKTWEALVSFLTWAWHNQKMAKICRTNRLCFTCFQLTTRSMLGV